MAAAGASEGVHGRHERGQEQRPRDERDHPAGQHLADREDVRLRPMLGRAALVQCRDGPQRRAPERADPVLVDLLDRAVARRRKLAAARDPHRLVALREQHALRPDADRESEPRKLAEDAGAPARAVELLADRLLHRALEADPGAP